MDTKTLLYSGITVPAKLRDGSTVDVKLRLIKISEIPEFLDLAMEEVDALKFCVESPADLNPDALTDESFTELVARNTDLNFTRALAMTDQRLKRAEAGGLELARVASSLASLFSRFSPKSLSPAATPQSNS